MKKVLIKLGDNVTIPFKKHLTDACYDVYATSMKDYGDGRIEYGTGLYLAPEDFTQVDLRARSSIHKTGMILSNGIGTGDEGYRGEYKAVFYDVIKSLPNYKVGDRILQLQVVNREDIVFIPKNDLNDTPRGEGGYGSTGV